MRSNFNEAIEPAAKVLAATAISQSLSFCMERKYLEDITSKPVFEIDPIAPTSTDEAAWISITQIGRPLEKSAENCFTAIQKILYSCFLPKEMQLLFLVVGNPLKTNIFLGLRSSGKALPPKNIVRNINEFIKGTWPGLQTKIVKQDDPVLLEYKEAISNETFENVFAFTGIPSMESQYKTLYPATVDKLIAGMGKSKNFAYLVVADPIESNETDKMLFQCREMNGQAESLKSLNITEGMSQGTSSSYSTSHSNSHTASISESISKKDFSKLGKMALAATGLGMAASVFPAAGTVLNGCADTAGAIASSAVGIIGSSMVGNLVSGLMPQKSTSTSSSESTSDTTSQTTGFNDSKSQSISRNLVNKHIESVSEHLFYHSKRLETGKAIGLWKVGVFLMADKKSSLQGGALQLRSILSGQESIFEPIRIHDISNVIDEPVCKNQTLRELTLGKMNAPQLLINDIHGRRFDHPLGPHFGELKTVLTTKELSYLINFPMQSFPGIRVVDSSPDFLLESPIDGTSSGIISLGKILNGGTPTELNYQLSLDSLISHVLVSGIKGSGKTRTVQKILTEVLNQNIPVLILEPSKTEYVDWAISYNREHPDNPINVYMPGCTHIFDRNNRTKLPIRQLRLNPFEIVWLSKNQTPNALSHLEKVKKIFASLMSEFDALPLVIEDLICSAYQNCGTNWMLGDQDYDNQHYPTLQGIVSLVDDVLNGLGFDNRSFHHYRLCLLSRLNQLMLGWKKDLFGADISTPFKDVFDSPCIINLSNLQDSEEKILAINLLIMFLYEYRQSTYEIQDYSTKVRHITVMENAHQTIRKIESDTSIPCSSLNSDIMAQLSTWGEGLVLTESNPSLLNDDVLKDTNVKLIHRTIGESNTKTVADSIGISKEQALILPKMSIGQCLATSLHSPGTHWITIEN